MPSGTALNLVLVFHRPKVTAVPVSTGSRNAGRRRVADENATQRDLIVVFTERSGHPFAQGRTDCAATSR
jgi:hypothetical protein